MSLCGLSLSQLIVARAQRVYLPGEWDTMREPGEQHAIGGIIDPARRERLGPRPAEACRRAVQKQRALPGMRTTLCNCDSRSLS